MDRNFVNQLTRGQSVETIFFVREKSLTKTKAGIPYLSLRLADRTGEVEGRIWDNALEFCSLFEKEDFVKVRAEVDEFQGVLQLRVSKLRKCVASEVQLEDFLPKTTKDVESMFDELRSIASGIRQPDLRKLAECFFQDPEWARKFKLAPAAKAVHHVYLGGLLEHTLSVAQLVLIVAPRYRGVDPDLLLAAAIFHDMGKISELSFERSFDYTDPGRLLGHIVLTVEMIDRKIGTIPDFPEQLGLLLKHLVISHHGQYEFGSPKLPMTLEALLLNHLDDLDAKMNAVLALLDKEKENPSRWTTYHKLMERFIYKPGENG